MVRPPLTKRPSCRVMFPNKILAHKENDLRARCILVYHLHFNQEVIGPKSSSHHEYIEKLTCNFLGNFKYQIILMNYRKFELLIIKNISVYNKVLEHILVSSDDADDAHVSYQYNNKIKKNILGPNQRSLFLRQSSKIKRVS